MANFRIYNAKLTSLRNMQRVTQTMKMVSSTKLRRAQEARRKADQFIRTLASIAARVARSTPLAQNPLVAPRPEIRNVLLLLITSDKGLCGGFNSLLIKQVQAWIGERKSRIKNLRLSFCGLHGYTYFKSKVDVRNYYDGVTAAPDFNHALTVGRDILQSYKDGKYDEVHLAYNLAHSPLSRTPTIERLLPFVFDVKSAAPADRIEPLFEPEADELIGSILEKMVYTRVFFALLENAAGEHGARMTAMDSATANIDKLCDKYALLRNQARQGAITNELMEIVSGAESLK